MAAVLLILVRTCASSGTSADALICRVVLALVFFGAVLGGIATIGLTFAFHTRRLAGKTTSSTTILAGYLLYAVMLPILTTVVITGHFYITAFVHWFLCDGYARYGGWVYVLITTTVLDLFFEVRFLYWFHKYEERYKDQTNRALLQVNDGLKDSLQRVWWLPKWRFEVLQVLFMVWSGSVLLLVWRSIDMHALMHLASSSLEFQV